MAISSLLIANRGEIAIRIARAAAELGIRTIAVYSEDDATSLHAHRADEAVPLAGTGPAAYLDIAQLVRLAQGHGCDGIHPGYGFLSENAAFARACAEAGLTFVGPGAEALDLFGDKARARALAEQHGVPVVPGTSGATSLEDAREFLASRPAGTAVMLKAVAGGGGRGIRAVRALDELDNAFARCQSEAKASFGNGDVYAEQLITRARHIEVQVLGDATGEVVHLWERECSLQRRNQKVVEVAPSPSLSAALRQRITGAAMHLARQAHYTNAGTFEFLLDLDTPEAFYFIEANARLQVEHTVTEEVSGIDLVQAQLRLAGGETLRDLGLVQDRIPRPHGYAIQCRVNMETFTPTGAVRPGGGTITVFEAPTGPGVRIDTFAYAGYTTSPQFDSLLAKLIVHSPAPEFGAAVARASRALAEFRIEGAGTNLEFLRNLLRHPDVTANDNLTTRFVEEHMAELVVASEARPPVPAPKPLETATRGLAGVKVDVRDPLAVLDYGKTGAPVSSAAVSATPVVTSPRQQGPEGTAAVVAPLQGTIVEIGVTEGDLVALGQQLFVMEAMKMEHVVTAAVSGLVRGLTVRRGDAVFEGHALAFIEPRAVETTGEDAAIEADLDHVRPDLALIHERHAITLDAERPDAVARRRKTHQRTARENIDDLCDAGTFMEHGGLVLTPGTGLPMEEVIRKFPTDGMVTGVGSVNGHLFDEHTARTVVLSYDYTVLAGTQGSINHPKTDRMLELAEKWRIPVVLFAEGGGGRAGTGGQRSGGAAVSGAMDGFAGRPLDTPTFSTMGRLSGTVPTIGIVSGRCFAGNAALLGCCDVIIATADANIGMGGPAMVEGGGLGVFLPEEIGPINIQSPNGVVDIAVADEAEAVAAARKYLSYFQGRVRDWECADQRLLRGIIPENRLRMYDVRRVIDTLADAGSVLELRRGFGLGMVTAFIRVEGRPMGVIANNPSHLAGAIDSDGSDKAARFMQLCDAFDIPLLVLCDTPGMMVGPEVEKTALVRHCSRLFVIGANLTIPHVTIVLRKAYGLGAQAMAGGNLKESFFTVAWPTGEFGGMGLEGQVKLGFRNELANIEDPAKRLARYQELVARAYERSKAVHQGVSFGVDDVIDPMDSRRWITRALESVPEPPPRREKKRPCVDTW